MTHDVHAARIADRVVRIRDGRLSEQWHPDDPDDEQLVLDSSGWLRLPDGARARAGAGASVRLRERAGVIELRGSGPDGTERDDADPVAVPGPVDGSVDGPAGGPLAGLDAVSLRFGPRTVLDALDLRVEAGTLTVLRGRSGSGKSTLLHVLLGLIDPDAGEAHLAGRGLRGLSRAERARLRRATVAVGLQMGALVETADARENLTLARRARGLPAHNGGTAGAGGADAADVEHDLLAALGLTAVLRRPVRVLSGGERQRVVVARSLAVRRPLVILDEPTSQQDERNTARTAVLLSAAAAAGAAVVCATHDDAVAAAADVVVDLG